MDYKNLAEILVKQEKISLELLTKDHQEKDKFQEILIKKDAKELPYFFRGFSGSSFLAITRLLEEEINLGKIYLSVQRLHRKYNNPRTFYSRDLRLWSGLPKLQYNETHCDFGINGNIGLIQAPEVAASEVYENILPSLSLQLIRHYRCQEGNMYPPNEEMDLYKITKIMETKNDKTKFRTKN